MKDSDASLRRVKSFLKAASNDEWTSVSVHLGEKSECVNVNGSAWSFGKAVTIKTEGESCAIVDLQRAVFRPSKRASIPSITSQERRFESKVRQTMLALGYTLIVDGGSLTKRDEGRVWLQFQKPLRDTRDVRREISCLSTLNVSAMV